MDAKPGPQTALFLRTDGSILVAHGDQAIEMSPSPKQLLELGLSAMRLAVTQDSTLWGELLRGLDEPFNPPASDSLMPLCSTLQ